MLPVADVLAAAGLGEYTKAVKDAGYDTVDDLAAAPIKELAEELGLKLPQARRIHTAIAKLRGGGAEGASSAPSRSASTPESNDNDDGGGGGGGGAAAGASLAAQREQSLRATFHGADVDGDGRLSEAEFAQMCTQLSLEGVCGHFPPRPLDYAAFVRGLVAISRLDAWPESETFEPLHIIDKSGNDLVANEAALRELTAFDQPLRIIGIVGTYRSGKSYLMNRLFRQQNGFSCGGGTQGVTHGIWAWIKKPKDGSAPILLLDSEGLYDIDNPNPDYDVKLFSTTLLLCSQFYLNMKVVLDTQSFLTLAGVARIASQLSFDGKEPDGDGLDFYKHFPKLNFVLRDAFLEMAERRAEEHLENALKEVNPGRAKGAQRDANEVRHFIRDSFAERKLVRMVRPVGDEKALQVVNELDWEKEVRLEFAAQMAAVRHECITSLKEKTLTVDGVTETLTGSLVAQLVPRLVESVNSGVLNFKSVFDSVNDELCLTAKNDAIETFRVELDEAIKDSPLPWEQEELRETVSSIMEDVHDMYFKKAKGAGRLDIYAEMCECLGVQEREEAGKLAKDAAQAAPPPAAGAGKHDVGEGAGATSLVADLMRRNHSASEKVCRDVIDAALEMLRKEEVKSAEALDAYDKKQEEARAAAERQFVGPARAAMAQQLSNELIALNKEKRMDANLSDAQEAMRKAQDDVKKQAAEHKRQQQELTSKIKENEAKNRELKEMHDKLEKQCIEDIARHKKAMKEQAKLADKMMKEAVAKGQAEVEKSFKADMARMEEEQKKKDAEHEKKLTEMREEMRRAEEKAASAGSGMMETLVQLLAAGGGGGGGFGGGGGGGGGDFDDGPAPAKRGGGGGRSYRCSNCGTPSSHYITTCPRRGGGAYKGKAKRAPKKAVARGKKKK